ncbi:MAG: polysaccharide pyruvyl transferase family protein [Candidatus Thiodiazotropha sp.]
MSHTIILHDSNKPSNIGNAFFTTGVKYMLKTVCKKSIVLSGPSKTSTGWPVRLNYNMKNDLDYISYSEPDWFVISGPMLDAKFPSKYEKTFDKIFNNGITKLVILSAGGIEYSEQEISICRRFLKKYPPYIMFTRDYETYENYADLAKHSHNGICNAFFVSDYFPGYPTPSLEPYIVASFDNSKEPEIDLDVIDNIDHFISPDAQFKQVHRLQMLLNETVPKKSGKFTVVRPNHNVMRLPVNFLLRKPNTFISQSYEGYLNIYKNCSLTLTDRIHGCVAALSYGNPARLYTNSKRAFLLNRAGVENVKNTIVKADLDRLGEEKDVMKKSLENIYKIEIKDYIT